MVRYENEEATNDHIGAESVDDIPECEFNANEPLIYKRQPSDNSPTQSALSA